MLSAGPRGSCRAAVGHAHLAARHRHVILPLLQLFLCCLQSEGGAAGEQAGEGYVCMEHGGEEAKGPSQRQHAHRRRAGAGSSGGGRQAAAQRAPAALALLGLVMHASTAQVVSLQDRRHHQLSTFTIIVNAVARARPALGPHLPLLPAAPQLLLKLIGLSVDVCKGRMVEKLLER